MIAKNSTISHRNHLTNLRSELAKLNENKTTKTIKYGRGQPTIADFLENEDNAKNTLIGKL